MADELPEAANKLIVEQNRKAFAEATPERLADELKTLKKLDANNDSTLQPAEALTYVTGGAPDARIQELVAASCAAKPSAEALKLLPEAIAGRLTLLQEIGGANKRLTPAQTLGLALENAGHSFLPKSDLTPKQNEQARGAQTAGDFQVIGRLSELMEKNPELRRAAASLDLVKPGDAPKPDELCKAVSEKPKGMVR